jgi:hypothetical protein
MSTIAQIEASIQTLPAGDFFALLGWMAERHIEVLSAGDFEPPELESALLKAIDSPRHLMDDALFNEIRVMSAQASN